MNLKIFYCFFFITSVGFSQNGTIKVEKQEDFLPRIAGKAGGEISKYFLCDSKGITIGHNSKVVSFVLYVIDHHNQELEIPIEGNVVTEEYCKKIMSLSEGSIVYFQNIMVESKGVRIRVSPIMFKIKDDD